MKLSHSISLFIVFLLLLHLAPLEAHQGFVTGHHKNNPPPHAGYGGGLGAGGFALGGGPGNAWNGPTTGQNNCNSGSGKGGKYPNKPRNFTPPAQVSDTSDFDNSVNRDMANVRLRSHKELEQAAVKYVAMYDAYTTAKKSQNPEVKKRTGEFLQKYRMAYAEFLKLLREDNIYDPKLPKNHAGVYNKKYQEVKHEKRSWNDDGLKEIEEAIKDKVTMGTDIDDVHTFITTKVSIFSGSTAPSEFVLDPPPMAPTASSDEANDDPNDTEYEDEPAPQREIDLEDDGSFDQ